MNLLGLITLVLLQVTPPDVSTLLIRKKGSAPVPDSIGVRYSKTGFYLVPGFLYSFKNWDTQETRTGKFIGLTADSGLVFRLKNGYHIDSYSDWKPITFRPQNDTVRLGAFILLLEDTRFSRSSLYLEHWEYEYRNVTLRTETFEKLEKIPSGVPDSSGNRRPTYGLLTRNAIKLYEQREDSSLILKRDLAHPESNRTIKKVRNVAWITPTSAKQINGLGLSFAGIMPMADDRCLTVNGISINLSLGGLAMMSYAVPVGIIMTPLYYLGEVSSSSLPDPDLRKAPVDKPLKISPADSLLPDSLKPCTVTTPRYKIPEPTYRFLDFDDKSRTNGIAVSLLIHDVSRHAGLAVAVGGNFSDTTSGVHLAGILNSSANSKGVSIAAVNDVKSGGGLQVGLVNTAKHFRGVQLGLWNKNHRRSLPLVNWNFKKKPTEVTAKTNFQSPQP